MLAFIALGTGGLEFAHNHQHLHANATHHHDHDKPAPAHDEANCFIHMLLNAPILAAAYVPLLVCLGLFVAFLTQIAPALAPQRAAFAIACRGPPACSLHLAVL